MRLVGGGIRTSAAAVPRSRPLTATDHASARRASRSPATVRAPTGLLRDNVRSTGAAFACADGPEAGQQIAVAPAGNDLGACAVCAMAGGTRKTLSPSAQSPGGGRRRGCPEADRRRRRRASPCDSNEQDPLAATLPPGRFAGKFFSAKPCRAGHPHRLQRADLAGRRGNDCSDLGGDWRRFRIEYKFPRPRQAARDSDPGRHACRRARTPCRDGSHSFLGSHIHGRSRPRPDRRRAAQHLRFPAKARRIGY